MVSTPTRTDGGSDAAAGGQPAASPPAAAPSRCPPGRRPGSPRHPAARVRGWYRGFWSALEGNGKSRNGSTYYLILGSTLALTAIGIMMVLSASSVEAIAAGESPYSAALKQGCSPRSASS